MSHLMTAKTKRAGQARPQPLVQEVVMEHHNDYVADLLMSLPPSGEDAVCVRCGDEADTRYLGLDWCESPCLIDVLAPLAVVCISCEAGSGISIWNFLCYQFRATTDSTPTPQGLVCCP